MSLPFFNLNNIPEPLHLPLAVEAGEAGLAGEELLHGGLFEVALLGDEPVQPAQQPIHIAQRRSDGALFGEGWQRKLHSAEFVPAASALSRWSQQQP